MGRVRGRAIGLFMAVGRIGAKLIAFCLGVSCPVTNQTTRSVPQLNDGYLRANIVPFNLWSMPSERIRYKGG